MGALCRVDRRAAGLETAAYFSLTSYTTVGYGDIPLPWRLLGPLEAAVGVLMLGWSTGMLVAAIGIIYRPAMAAPGVGREATQGRPAKHPFADLDS
jgi:hypothetical protein